jgi:cell division protein FtsB
MLEAAVIAQTQELHDAASWASIFMVVFLIALCILAWRLGVMIKNLVQSSRDWTIPKQDAKLNELRLSVESTAVRVESSRRDIDAAHAKADALEREQSHLRRTHMDEQEALLKEVRSVGAQVALLLSLRDELRDVKDQTVKLEQDVSSLVCFEDEQLRKQKLPDFCPLLKMDCPVGEGTAPKDKT